MTGSGSAEGRTREKQLILQHSFEGEGAPHLR